MPVDLKLITLRVHHQARQAGAIRGVLAGRLLDARRDAVERRLASQQQDVLLGKAERFDDVDDLAGVVGSIAAVNFRWSSRSFDRRDHKDCGYRRSKYSETSPPVSAHRQ